MSTNLESALAFVRKYPTDASLRNARLRRIVVFVISLALGCALVVASLASLGEAWSPVLILFGFAFILASVFAQVQSFRFQPLASQGLQDVLEMVNMCEDAKTILVAVVQANRSLCISDYQAMAAVRDITRAQAQEASAQKLRDQLYNIQN